MDYRDFNPRGCISLDQKIQYPKNSITYFNPRGCISLDHTRFLTIHPAGNFNPRGCISLDAGVLQPVEATFDFNPRGCISLDDYWLNIPIPYGKFQSTRLYKPRHQLFFIGPYPANFNPRGCISLDKETYVYTNKTAGISIHEAV